MAEECTRAKPLKNGSRFYFLHVQDVWKLCVSCARCFFFFRFVGQHDVRTNAAATHFSRTQLTARQFGESAKLYESGDVAAATYGHTLDLPPT